MLYCMVFICKNYRHKRLCEYLGLHAGEAGLFKCVVTGTVHVSEGTVCQLHESAPSTDTYSHKARHDIPHFCGTQRFMSYSTKAQHWTLSPFPITAI